MLKDRRCNLVIKIQRALNPAVFSHFPKALLDLGSEVVI